MTYLALVTWPALPGGHCIKEALYTQSPSPSLWLQSPGCSLVRGSHWRHSIPCPPSAHLQNFITARCASSSKGLGYIWFW
jgi:hypothetical protein